VLPPGPEHVSAQKPTLGLRGHVIDISIDERLCLLRLAGFQQQPGAEKIHDCKLRLQPSGRFEIGTRFRPFLVVTKQLPAANEEVGFGRLPQFLRERIDQELIVAMPPRSRG
jgi:hypothetical protein